MANGTVPPGYVPPTPLSKEEAKREYEYGQRSKAAQSKLKTQNTKARQEAIKKKGRQNYSYSTISNPTDFGAGAAGPGVPYSIKTTSVPETVSDPTKVPSWAAKVSQDSSAKARGDRFLWKPGKAVDWKLAAIRRRLGNG